MDLLRVCSCMGSTDRDSVDETETKCCSRRYPAVTAPAAEAVAKQRREVNSRGAPTAFCLYVIAN